MFSRFLSQGNFCLKQKCWGLFQIIVKSFSWETNYWHLVVDENKSKLLFNRLKFFEVKLFWFIIFLVLQLPETVSTFCWYFFISFLKIYFLSSWLIIFYCLEICLELIANFCQENFQLYFVNQRKLLSRNQKSIAKRT